MVKGSAPKALDPLRYHINPRTDLNKLEEGMPWRTIKDEFGKFKWIDREGRVYCKNSEPKPKKNNSSDKKSNFMIKAKSIPVTPKTVAASNGSAREKWLLTIYKEIESFLQNMAITDSDPVEVSWQMASTMSDGFCAQTAHCPCDAISNVGQNGHCQAQHSLACEESHLWLARGATLVAEKKEISNFVNSNFNIKTRLWFVTAKEAVL